jgi:ribosome-associated heat shock protein Hsp15
VTRPERRPGPAGDAPARETVRLDKWLWQARFYRSRTLARAAIEGGALRLNGTRTRRPSIAVGSGDVLTFVLGGQVRLLRILGTGQRRGPAPEARLLYADLAEAADPAAGAAGAPSAQSPAPPLD